MPVWLALKFVVPPLSPLPSGTITRSDVLGHLLPAMGLDWSHPGIARLLTDIARNNYQVSDGRSAAEAQSSCKYFKTCALLAEYVPGLEVHELP